MNAVRWTSVLAVTISGRSSCSTRSGVSGHADQARRVGQEEGDLLRGDRVGGHDQVALVLAVLVVDDDDDLAPPDCLDRVLDC